MFMKRDGELEFESTVPETDTLYKISAVVPSYNREKTIKRCIDSIINQTYHVFEIIVVDDGSSDNTVSIIEKEYSDRVTIIEQNHKGAQAARNAGIRKAKGDYIAFLDSDDEWLPDKLELQVRELKKNENAVICGNGYIQTDWKNEIPLVYHSHDVKHFRKGNRKIFRMRGVSGQAYHAILKNSFCMFQAILTSRNNLFEIGLLDENVPSYQEWDTGIRLAQKFEFIFIRKPLFVYYLHDGDTISKNSRKDIDGMEYILEKFKCEIISVFGCQELAARYKELMCRCIKYRDSRMIKFLFRYIMAAGILLYSNKRKGNHNS